MWLGRTGMCHHAHPKPSLFILLHFCSFGFIFSKSVYFLFLCFYLLLFYFLPSFSPPPSLTSFALPLLFFLSFFFFLDTTLTCSLRLSFLCIFYLCLPLQEPQERASCRILFLILKSLISQTLIFPFTFILLSWLLCFCL